MRDPSGVNATNATESVCPRSTVSCVPVAASQIAAVLSASAVTPRLPSGLKPAACPRMTATGVPVAPSHVRTVSSCPGWTMRACSPVVTMRLPSGLKVASLPAMAAISFPSSAFQRRTPSSFEAVRMRDPSGLKAAEPTALPWLLNVSRRFDSHIVVASEVRGAAIAPAPWMVASCAAWTPSFMAVSHAPRSRSLVASSAMRPT